MYSGTIDVYMLSHYQDCLIRSMPIHFHLIRIIMSPLIFSTYLRTETCPFFLSWIPIFVSWISKQEYILQYQAVKNAVNYQQLLWLFNMSSNLWLMIFSCIYVDKLQYLNHGNDRKYCLGNDWIYFHTCYYGTGMEVSKGTNKKCVNY